MSAGGGVARHAAKHVADAQLRKIEREGHLPVVLGVETVADEVIRFLAGAPRPT